MPDLPQIAVTADQLETPPDLVALLQQRMLNAFHREEARELGRWLPQPIVYLDGDGTWWQLGADHTADIALSGPPTT